MKHIVPHDLGPALAKRAAQAAIEAYSARFAEYQPKANWVNERRAEISFKVKGIALNGTLEVGPSTIEMDLDVPFLLRPIKGKALEVIDREVKVWIGKAKKGEL